MYFHHLILTFISLVKIASSKCDGHHHHQGGSVQHRKTAITNVLVWDGTKFPRSRSTVVIVDGIISNENSVGAVIINGKGGFLIPGLIDSHVHLTDCAYLATLQKYGITTALDMGTTPYEAVAKCGEHGVTDIRGSGAAGTVNGTKISFVPGLPTDSFIPTPEAGRAFVASRKAEGVDYIKLFLDPLGPDDETVQAVCAPCSSRSKQLKLIIDLRWSKQLIKKIYKSSLMLPHMQHMYRLQERAWISLLTPRLIKLWMTL